MAERPRRWSSPQRSTESPLTMMSRAERVDCAPVGIALPERGSASESCAEAKRGDSVKLTNAQRMTPARVTASI